MPKAKIFNCFEVKNETATSADLYFYGDIVSDWWGAWQDTVEQVSLLQVGASSGYMPRNGIAGSSGSTMSNFLRSCQTYLQS